MKINTASWHYRVLKWLGSSYGNWFDPPTSLCSYFWSFPGYLARFIFISLLAGFGISYMPLSLYAWLHNGSHGCQWMFLGTLTIVAVFFTVAFIAQIFSKHEEDSGFLYLASEWVRAKKNRVCPMITYVSPKGENKDG